MSILSRERNAEFGVFGGCQVPFAQIGAGKAYYPSLPRFFMKTLIDCLGWLIVALHGAYNLDIFLYMPRLLRFVRLAIHPA